jgi:hypothetical protein
MANEINLSFAFSVNKPGVTQGPIGPVTTPQSITMTGSVYVSGTDTAPITTAGAVPLGAVTQPHWSYWQNNDPTNYMQVLDGVSGAVLIRLAPGEQSPLPLDPGCTPYVLANTATVSYTYWIFQL